MEATDQEHDSFSNSLKLTVKLVLLQNGNKYPSVPEANVIHMKE
jgi:hypothetical protein